MPYSPITELPAGPFNMAHYCIGAPATSLADKIALTVVSDARSAAASEIWTFGDLEDAILRLSHGFAGIGLSQGDRILIRLDNTSAYAILFFAAIAGGYIPLPTSSALTEAEALFLLKDSGAKAVAVSDGLMLPHLPSHTVVLRDSDVARLMSEGERGSYAPTHANDPAYLIYTSGTTAKPKGVLHAHRTSFGRRPTYQGWYGITLEDRMLHAGAFNWTYTLGTGLIDPWANGAATVIYTGEKEPAIWPHLVCRTGATLFAAVPGVFRQILKYAPPGWINVGKLRHGVVAGETPPPDLFTSWSQRTGTELYEALGMSEISTYISTGPGMPRKPGAAGKPQPGRRIAILPLEGGTKELPPGENGLLAVHRSDPGLMLGYWNRPDEEALVFRGDWFIGGDLARMDEDGYITHTGRANDLMKALGYRVSPLEVEAALIEHPGISDVACAEIAVRDDVTVIGAFVVPSLSPPPSRQDILAFAAQRLASYKCPREIVFVESLPLTANGKIRRSSLPGLFTAGHVDS